jgi:hypothetical protein
MNSRYVLSTSDNGRKAKRERQKIRKIVGGVRSQAKAPYRGRVVGQALEARPRTAPVGPRNEPFAITPEKTDAGWSLDRIASWLSAVGAGQAARGVLAWGKATKDVAQPRGH